MIMTKISTNKWENREKEGREKGGGKKKDRKINGDGCS